LPWMAEHAVSPQLTQLSQPEAVQQTSQLSTSQASTLTQDQLDQFLLDPNAEMIQGRTLYPRFYWRGQGIAQAHPSPAYVARDYSRLGFLLMMNQITPIVLPSKVVPDNFPISSDAIVFGCKQSDYVEARLIVFPKQSLIFESESPFSQCLTNPSE